MMMATKQHMRKIVLAFSSCSLLFVQSCGSTSVGSIATDPDLQISSATQQSSQEAQDAATGWSEFLHSKSYAGQLALKFDSYVRYNKGVWLDETGRLVNGLEQYPALFPDIVVTPRVAEADIAQVRTMRTKFAARGVAVQPWEHYYFIDAVSPDLAQRLITFFHDHARVEWVQPLPSLQMDVRRSVAQAKNIAVPEFSEGFPQYYLEGPEVGGLNIVAAWDRGLTGANQTVAMWEFAWNSDHQDFPENWSPLCSPIIIEYGFCPMHPDALDFSPEVQHGTASAAVIAAPDNGVGVTGIAPAVFFRPVPSLSKAGVSNASIDDMIMKAADSEDLDLRGLVVAIEEGYGDKGYPFESYKIHFESLKNLVQIGAVVVQPVGNIGANFDLPEHNTPNCDSCPKLHLGQSSGSILVGASSGPDLGKLPESSCGERVDVFAWGAGVTTAGYGDHPISNPDDENQWYTAIYGGTSASAPIVAGVAALLQEHVQNLYADEYANGNIVYLDSQQMVELMKASGTPQSDDECNIGVQPDVGLALDLLDAGAITPTIAFDNTYCGDSLTPQCLETCLSAPPASMKDVEQVKAWLVSGPLNDKAQCGNVCAFAPGSQECAQWCKTVDDVDGWFDPDGLSSDNKGKPLKSVCESIFVEPAKPMDLDGDQIADLIAFDRNGSSGRFYVDRSGMNYGGSEHGFGTWDLIVDFDLEAQQGEDNERIFPVVADYNSDGHVDFALYNADTGLWQVKYTRDEWLEHELLLANFEQWDMERDWSVLEPAVWEPGSRPFAENFFGGSSVTFNHSAQKYEVVHRVDMGLVTPSALWQVAYGESDYSSFNIQHDYYYTLDGGEGAKGWGYRPVVLPTTNGAQPAIVPPFETVHGVAVYSLSLDSPVKTLEASNLDSVETQVVGGRFGGPLRVSARDANDDEWYFVNSGLEAGEGPTSGFGDINCFPIAADYDGDGIDDRGVLCPQGVWRIAFSSKPGEAPTEIVLVPPVDALPGCIYSGGVSPESIEAIFGTLDLPKAPTGPRFASCLAKQPEDPYECLSQ